MPYFLPAQGWATRTQHELVWSFLGSRSQKNLILIRPCLSVSTSLPEVPTTTAVCGPAMTGFGALRGERYCGVLELAPMAMLARPPPAPVGIARNSQRK